MEAKTYGLRNRHSGQTAFQVNLKRGLTMRSRPSSTDQRLPDGQWPTRHEDKSIKSCMKRQVYAASRCRTIDKMGNKGNVEVQALVDGSGVDLYVLLVLIRKFFFISS